LVTYSTTKFTPAGLFDVIIPLITSLAPVTGGTGDVVGPSSATDERIARWDTSSGKLLQDSSVSITDSGTVGFRGTEYANSAGKLLSIADTAGRLAPLNLVGPGTLRVDANGVVSVLLDYPPIITPHNLTSNTSDPNFTVSTSGVLLNTPGTWGGWRAFDELGSNNYWGSFNQSFSNSTGVQITGIIAPMPSPGSWIAAVFSSDKTVTKIRYKTINTGIPADFTVARYNGSSWIDSGFGVTNAPNTPSSPYLEYTIPGANGGGGPWRGIAMIISRVHNWDGNDVCYIGELDFQ
jgi:hypothetical protein